MSEIPSRDESDSDAGPVTIEELRAFTETFADLADDDVMASAWR